MIGPRSDKNDFKLGGGAEMVSIYTFFKFGPRCGLNNPINRSKGQISHACCSGALPSLSFAERDAGASKSPLLFLPVNPQLPYPAKRFFHVVQPGGERFFHVVENVFFVFCTRFYLGFEAAFFPRLPIWAGGGNTPENNAVSVFFN